MAEFYYKFWRSFTTNNGIKISIILEFMVKFLDLLKSKYLQQSQTGQ